MTDRALCKAVERNPGKLGGAWVFQDTRVPVSALFENLRDGATVEQFLAWFPGVEKWMVEAALGARSGRYGTVLTARIYCKNKATMRFRFDHDKSRRLRENRKRFFPTRTMKIADQTIQSSIALSAG